MPSSLISSKKQVVLLWAGGHAVAAGIKLITLPHLTGVDLPAGK